MTSITEVKIIGIPSPLFFPVQWTTTIDASDCESLVFRCFTRAAGSWFSIGNREFAEATAVVNHDCNYAVIYGLEPRAELELQIRASTTDGTVVASSDPIRFTLEASTEPAMTLWWAAIFEHLAPPEADVQAVVHQALWPQQTDQNALNWIQRTPSGAFAFSNDDRASLAERARQAMLQVDLEAIGTAVLDRAGQPVAARQGNDERSSGGGGAHMASATSAAEAELDGLRRQLDEANSRADAARAAQAEDVKRRADAAQAAQAELDGLRRQLNEANSRADAAQAAEAELDGLRRQLNEANSRTDAAQAAQAELDGLRRQLDEANSRVPAAGSSPVRVRRPSAQWGDEFRDEDSSSANAPAPLAVGCDADTQDRSRSTSPIEPMPEPKHKHGLQVPAVETEPEQSSLKHQVAQLEQEREALLAKVAQLQQRHDAAAARAELPLQERTEWQTQVTRLQHDRDALQTQLTELQRRMPAETADENQVTLMQMQQQLAALMRAFTDHREQHLLV